MVAEAFHEVVSNLIFQALPIKEKIASAILSPKVNCLPSYLGQTTQAQYNWISLWSTNIGNWLIPGKKIQESHSVSELSLEFA